jgi:hypothetical protein
MRFRHSLASGTMSVHHSTDRREGATDMIPSHTSYAVATHRHHERLDTAARIREIRNARREGSLNVDRTAHRRRTVARLAAGALATLKAAIHI